MKKVSIYKISFDGLDRCYVGKSENVKMRIKGHISSLNRGKHVNVEMQNDFTKGLIFNPKIDILKSDVAYIEGLSVERSYIMKFKDTCYNISMLTSNGNIIEMNPIIRNINIETTKEDRKYLIKRYGSLGGALKVLANAGPAELAMDLANKLINENMRLENLIKELKKSSNT